MGSKGSFIKEIWGAFKGVLVFSAAFLILSFWFFLSVSNGWFDSKFQEVKSFYDHDPIINYCSDLTEYRSVYKEGILLATRSNLMIYEENGDSSILVFDCDSFAGEENDGYQKLFMETYCSYPLQDISEGMQVRIEYNAKIERENSFPNVLKPLYWINLVIDKTIEPFSYLGAGTKISIYYLGVLLFKNLNLWGLLIAIISLPTVSFFFTKALAKRNRRLSQNKDEKVDEGNFVLSFISNLSLAIGILLFVLELIT